MGRERPPKCKECNDVYLTNPKSKKEGVCRECKKDIGAGNMGKGFSWKDAPWFDANGLKDIAKIQKNTVLENLQKQNI